MSEQAALATVEKRKSPREGTGGLNDRQRVFVERYCLHWNTSRAAREAGYAEASAPQQGYDLLKNPYVATEIERRLGELAIPPELTIARLSLQAQNAASQYFGIDEGGSLRVNLQGLLDAGLGHLIKGAKETKYGQVIEFYDAQAALALVAKHQGLIQPDNNTNVSITQTIVQMSGAEALQALAELFDRVGIVADVANYVLERLQAAPVEDVDETLEAVWTEEE